MTVSPTLRIGVMTAWVYISATQETGGSHALEGGYVNIWATVRLANGTAYDVHLLHTEGADINERSVLDRTGPPSANPTAALLTVPRGPVSFCRHWTDESGSDSAHDNWPVATHAIEDAWVQYTAVLPPTTDLVAMKFGADVADERGYVWFDQVSESDTAFPCSSAAIAAKD